MRHHTPRTHHESRVLAAKSQLLRELRSRKRGMAFRADNGPDTVRCDARTIHLPKIGAVRTREACRFPGPVRECTVKHDGIRWQAAVVCEMEVPEPKAAGVVAGVDVGLRRWATVHDGTQAVASDNPRPLKRALAKLRRVNRRIARSRTIHGKKRRSRRDGERRRLYRRVTNIRLDAIHKATTAIAKRSRLVSIESLHVAGWMRSRRLSRATADASPSRFLSLLKWKCQREGGRLVEAGRFYPSSKTCSACGAVNADLRFDETWRCRACGARHHRDDNAALNLRRQGLAADVESVSDDREAAVLDEASTRQIIPDSAR